MFLRLPTVYPITDKALARRASHLSIVRDLVAGGATMIQLRDKVTPTAEYLLDLRRCAEYAAKRGVQLIVNDRCDLALASGIDGVHLGQDDLPPAAARRVLPPGAIVGFSTHSAAQIRSASSEPVDYVGFGPVFATSSKDNPSPVVGLRKLRSACGRSSRPVVAIGGIQMGNLEEVIGAGAASVAVVSALMRAPRIAAEMERWLRAAEGIATARL